MWSVVHPLGIAAFAVLGFSWFILVTSRNIALLDYLILHEVYGRLFTGEHHRNSQWYYAFAYLPMLFAGLMPWSFGWIRRDIREFFRGLVSDPARLFLLLWVVMPLVIFMLASSRLILYMLPLCVPLAVATSRLQPPDWLSKRATWISLAAVVAVLVTIRVGVARMPTDKDYRVRAALFDMPESVDEFIFVDATAEWGLAFYTGRSVEEVYLHGTANNESLEEELVDDASSESAGEELVLVVRYPDRELVREIIASSRRIILSETEIDNRVLIRVASDRRAD
jgi:4-amino-4-deoxy-L-arabinose transferase